MLEHLGATLLEDRIYRHLVTVPAATMQALAAEIDAAPAEVAQALSALEERGLVGRSGTAPVRYVAAAPEVAVEEALREREAALHHARGELAELINVHRSARRTRAASEIVEIMDDPDSFRRRVLALMHSAHHEALALVRPPFVAVGLEEARAIPVPIRATRTRVIYDRTFLDIPDIVTVIRTETQAGDEYRLHSDVPLKLTIFDRSTAVLPAVQGPGWTSAMLIVHRSTLLDALIGFFEHVWETATPFPGLDETGADETPTEDSLLDSVDQYLLSLLLAGLTDQAIAGQLGIGLRSVQRRVHDLMMRTGAQTRIQLGWHAARENWLAAGELPSARCHPAGQPRTVQDAR